MPEPITDEQIKALARDLTPADHERRPPPPEVWDAIAAEVGIADEVGIAGEADIADGDQADGPPPLATVLRFPRRLPTTVLAVAAAVLAVVGVAGVLIISTGDGDSVVAEVAMTDDGLQVAAPGDGRAELVQTDDGLAVDLDVPDLPEGEGFYEAWLIDPDVEGMYSLGTVDGSGRLTVPAGVDPAAHPIVDISVEPIDGDPTHSGQSVLRGTFTI